LIDAIAKADTLIEALGWIRRFRDKITVIKLGGSFMDDADALRHVLVDIVFMESVGMRPVVVHGGGKAINRAMDEAGIQPRFIQGRRVTDEATLQIVERVLAGETNVNLARARQESEFPYDLCTVW
jgi:acetylglutamate kinase